MIASPLGRPPAALLLLPLLLAGCAAPAGSAGPAAALPAAETPRPGPPPDAAELEAASTRRASAAELAVWNDPSFRARLVESYAAETEIEPRVTVLERDRLQKVFDLIASERHDEALALLAEHGGPAASGVFDFTAANIHFQQERWPEAAAACRAAVGKFPRFRRAWKNLGLILVREGDLAGAVPALTRVIELGGGDALTWGLLGFAAAGTGDHLAAETAYRMAVLLDPATLDWKLGLARSFFEQERFADAVALTELLIAGAPTRADFWLLQANALLGLGQPLRAAEDLQVVEHLGGSTRDSLNLLGDIYVNEELFDLAVDSYVRAMERDDQGGVARPLRAAQVLTARGALDATARLVERIEALRGPALQDDDRIALLKLRARLALAAGEGDEEAAVLQEIVALDPLDGDALLLLGQHSNRRGDAEQAIFYFERAASLPSFEADARVRHAQLLVVQGRFAEALPLLRRAQTLEPRDNVQQYLEQIERLAGQRPG